jgi:dynein assembly factor 5
MILLLKSVSDFKLLYPELLKRLDDSHDNLRIVAAQTLQHFITDIDRWTGLMKTIPHPEDTYVECELDDVHWESLFKGMAIHLDDMNQAVQESIASVFTAMMHLSCVPKQVLKSHLESVKHKHRSTRFIDIIVTQ